MTSNKTDPYTDITILCKQLEDNITKELSDLILSCSTVTEGYIKLKGRPWSVMEQLLHVNSEVSESYDIVRKEDMSDPDTIDALFEELTDIILSAITATNIMIYNLQVYKPYLYGDEKKLRANHEKIVRKTVNKVIQRLKTRIEERQDK